MASKHDEITWILQKVGEDDIEIIHQRDGMVVHIKTVAQPQSAVGDEQVEKPKGKWAKVAEELAQQNLLRDGLGDELRQHSREFRESFTLK